MDHRIDDIAFDHRIDVINQHISEVQYLVLCSMQLVLLTLVKKKPVRAAIKLISVTSLFSATSTTSLHPKLWTDVVKQACEVLLARGVLG